MQTHTRVSFVQPSHLSTLRLLDSTIMILPQVFKASNVEFVVENSSARETASVVIGLFCFLKSSMHQRHPKWVLELG